MDLIYIRNLRIETIIGVNERERCEKQWVSLDLELATDGAKAAERDHIEDACDYKIIKDRLVDYVSDSRFHLIETLAEQIGALVLREFDISWLRLRLGKPGALTGAEDVGIIIERERKPS